MSVLKERQRSANYINDEMMVIVQNISLWFCVIYILILYIIIVIIIIIIIIIIKY